VIRRRPPARAGVAIKETIVVGKHALRKIDVALTLDFDVHVDPALLSAGEGDLHQRVGKASAEFGVAHHLPQFGVLELVTLRLVDLGVRFGKVKRHEFGKGVFDQHRSKKSSRDSASSTLSIQVSSCSMLALVRRAQTASGKRPKR
jgi:hypothetical protein